STLPQQSSIHDESQQALQKEALAARRESFFRPAGIIPDPGGSNARGPEEMKFFCFFLFTKRSAALL
ncbi:MAG: hypothetical protein POH28_08805, partial [Acidocella sp.]|nr:hypothetical protein [Acidocella sp.]